MNGKIYGILLTYIETIFNINIKIILIVKRFMIAICVFNWQLKFEVNNLKILILKGEHYGLQGLFE